jgi:hypothetical protein
MKYTTMKSVQNKTTIRDSYQEASGWDIQAALALTNSYVPRGCS